MSLVPPTAAAALTWSSILLSFPWPAPRFNLACPDSLEVCQRLSDPAAADSCSEPETETAEVFTSLLNGCDASCLLLDVGCNMGYFSGLAVSHGATSECYEANPTWTASAERTRQLNGAGFASRLSVHTKAVVGDDGPASLDFSSSWHACGIGDGRDAAQWTVPTVSMRSMLANRNVTLLKLDIDSNEGELLHVATEMLVAKQTAIRSILVELGESNGHTLASASAWSDRGDGMSNPRGGDVRDLWRLQQLGYDVYRVNIHTNHEIYDWRGHDVNLHPTHSTNEGAHYERMYGLRSMRALEKLRRHADASSYPELVTWGQSFLITREVLSEPRKHHEMDLSHTRLSSPLNEGNPAVPRPRT